MNFNYKSLITGFEKELACFLTSRGFLSGARLSRGFQFRSQSHILGYRSQIVSLQQPGFLNSKIFILKPSISARECEMQSCLNVEVDGRRASTLSNFGGATGHASSQMINTVPHFR